MGLLNPPYKNPLQYVAHIAQKLIKIVHLNFTARQQKLWHIFLYKRATDLILYFTSTDKWMLYVHLAATGLAINLSKAENSKLWMSHNKCETYIIDKPKKDRIITKNTCYTKKKTQGILNSYTQKAIN